APTSPAGDSLSRHRLMPALHLSLDPERIADPQLPAAGGFEGDEEDADVGRGHAGDARGLADRTRADALELLAALVGKSPEGGVVEVVRDRPAFQTAVLLQLAPLPVDVALVLELDLHLADGGPGQLRQFRQRAAEGVMADLRAAQEVEGGGRLL